jgi:cytoskeletal protein CcmA (bactofilin family)
MDQRILDPHRSLPGASAPSTAPSLESTTKTTISADLKIAGDVTSEGEVQLDGDIKGSIQCATLVVGRNSEILGDAIADEVVVRGHVHGSVYSNRVFLQSTAVVEGDIHHRIIIVEEGARFEGTCRRVQDPASIAAAERGSKAASSAASA